jgi:hypothetical protein
MNSNPLTPDVLCNVQVVSMFFYALRWSSCVELDALQTVSHRAQRAKLMLAGHALLI